MRSGSYLLSQLYHAAAARHGPAPVSGPGAAPGGTAGPSLLSLLIDMKTAYLWIVD